MLYSGWLAIGNYTIAVAAVSTTIVPILSVIFGRDIPVLTGCYITTAVILVQTMINLYGVRLTSHVNIIAVAAELIVPISSRARFSWR